MKIIKFIINIIMSFLLMVFITICIAQSIINNKLLNKEYFIAKIDDTGFYSQLTKEINDGFENYVYQSGLPEDVVKDIFNDDILRNDIDSIIAYVFENKELNTSEGLIKQNLDAKIEAYLNANNIKLNEQGQSNIESYEALISNEYRKKIVVSESLYSIAKDMVTTASKVMRKARSIPITGCIIIVLLLVIVNRKNLLDAINYCGISMLSCGGLFKIADYFINKNIKFDGLLIYSKSVTNLFVNVCNELMNMIEDYSTFLMICGGVSILITAVLNSYVKKNNEDVETPRFKPKRRKK